MTKSVVRHLMAEVPYGVLLSGGLDSSIVASIASREYKKLGNLDVMRSYCIGLKGNGFISTKILVISGLNGTLDRHLYARLLSLCSI